MRKQTVCRSRIMPDWQTNKGCRCIRQPSHKNNYFLLLVKSSDYSRASNFSFNLSLGAAPTNLSTICPPLKKSIVGMLRTPKSSAISAFSSTSHFPTISIPSYSSASSEMIGPTIRQGPHHVAQRSTTNGSSPFLYFSKFSVVIFTSILLFPVC